MHLTKDRITIVRIVLGLLALLCVGIVSLVAAEEPSAVTLLYFRGYGEDQAVRLVWKTGSEFNTAFFYLERADNQSGPFTMLEGIGIVPPAGDPLGGAEYEEYDSDVVNGQTYWYILVEVEFGGAENREGPISVTAGEPNPTPTSTNTPTPLPTNGGPGNSSQPTSTPTASSTPSPTAPSTNPTQQATPTAPLTRTPTNTGQGSNGGSQRPTSAPQDQNNNLSTNPLSPSIAEAADNGSYPVESTATFIPAPGAADGNDALNPLSNSSPSPYPADYEAKVVAATAQPNRQTSGLNTPVGGKPGARILTANQDNDEGTSSNTLLLWAGFIVALAIFAIGVFGSIIVFSRRRNRES